MKNDTAVSLLVTALVLALVCVPVMTANVTYPQEYYVLQLKANAANDHSAGWYDSAAAKAVDSVFYELRRQTILMEKQNELMAEQNELMRMQLNSKYVCSVTHRYNVAGAFNEFECARVTL